MIVVGYGMNESFEGEKGLPEFEKGLNRLLDTLAETKARLVLLSPTRHGDLGRPLPDPTRHNSDLERLRGSDVRPLGPAGGGAWPSRRSPATPRVSRAATTGMMTDDGLHFTPLGYWHAAEAVAAGLGVPPRGPSAWAVEIDRAGKVLVARQVKVDDVEADDEAIRFKAADPDLPRPLAPGFGPPRPPRVGTSPSTPADDRGAFPPACTLRFRGLRPGKYVLKIDGKAVATIPGGDPIVYLYRDPDGDRSERLRAAINAKNRLYFYRWRPQNETYLFGFRKHEQGQNAREIPLFDPLVEAKEKEIAKLKLPTAHSYELIREGGAEK